MRYFGEVRGQNPDPRHAAWFQGHEAACERVLADFFGKTPALAAAVASQMPRVPAPA